MSNSDSRQDMKFINLRRNILAILGNNWRKTGSTGPFAIHPIREEFSDIPDENFEVQIKSLAHNDYINLSDDSCWANLTEKGLAQLRIIHAEKNDENIVMVKKLE